MTTRINPNVNPTALYIIRIILVIAWIAIAGHLGYKGYQMMTHSKTTGTITEKNTKTVYSSNGSHRRQHSITIQYEIDGKTYTTTENTLFPFLKKIGGKTSVYFEKGNPENVLHTLSVFEFSILILIFLTVFLIGIQSFINALPQNKRTIA